MGLYRGGLRTIWEHVYYAFTAFKHLREIEYREFGAAEVVNLTMLLFKGINVEVDILK